jgi:uncharacterized protein
MDVLGRKNEKEILNDLLVSSKAEFVAIYGRRRVGKTFLIRQYLKNNMCFDFTGSDEEDNNVQLANFYREFSKQCIDNQLYPTNWSDAFALLSDYLYSLDKTQKVVVFIDELPWLDKPKSGFLAALQYFWNQHGSQMPHLLLITCGSAASWIIKNLMDAKGGLYNRVTQSIELKPFTLAETEAFLIHKNLKFTRYQILQLYMVMGGIPFYLDAIKPSKSVNQVINELCFEQNGLLAREFKPLYHSLFKDADNHLAMIEALAQTPYGMSRQQLLEATNIPNGGSFTRTIENLIDCGFIKQMVSFDKKNRDSIFRLVDFYSIFYVKFIRENTIGRVNVWQSIADSASYYAWCGYAFENICLLHIEQIHKSLGISGLYSQISSWMFKGNQEMPSTQIDLVIDRKDGIIHLFECKFTNKELTLTKEYTAKLRQRRAVFEYVTKTKKQVVTSLLTTFPAMRNEYFLEEIHSQVEADDLFV